MKKSLNLVLFPLLALGIFIGINAFIPSASGEGETKYTCSYDGNGYRCDPVSQGLEGEYDCSTSTSVCEKGGEDDDNVIINSCERNEGESEGKGYYYCKPEYGCDEPESKYDMYHCYIKDSGGYHCYDLEEGGYCETIEGGLANYFCYTDGRKIRGYNFYCDTTYNIISETNTGYYFAEPGRGGQYSCMGLVSMGPRGGYNWGNYVCRDPYNEESYQGCTYEGGEYVSEDEYIDEDEIVESGGYFCPKLYSYQVNRENGVYDFYVDNTNGSEKYICDSASNLEDDEEDGEEERGNTGSEYYCYNPMYDYEKYNNCTMNPSSPLKGPSSLRSSNGEYSCPITYYCYENEDGYFCEEDNYGDYYCRINDDLETYSCYLGGEYPLSNSCMVVEYDGDVRGFSEDSFLGFYCPGNIETHTIKFSVNDDSYGSIITSDGSMSLSGDISLPSGLTILIDENKIIILGEPVIAIPTQSTPEYSYSFSGWTNTCGDTLIQDCTITANFSRTEKEYTITFKDGDKTNVYTGTVGSSVVVPNWTKEGYTLSWDNNIPATMPAENLVITAHWTINQYTITFNLNGGSGAIEPIKDNYGTEIPEPIEPTKEGYIFGGWYDGNSKVTFPYRIPASNKTLTAHWNGGNSGGNGGYSGGGGGSKGSSSDNKRNNKQKEDNKAKEDNKPTEANKAKEDNKAKDLNNNGGINILPLDEEQKYSQEALDAYNWAYANGLTKYSNIKDARLDEYMNRSEMAKISTIFATKFRGEIPDENKREFCSKFSDLWKVEEDTKEYIIQSCELGNMGYQANGVDELQKFRPYTPVSLAETSIILSRMMWGNKYAVSETKWYQGHLWAVYEHRLIDNISEPFNNITRKDAFIMLYRLFFSNDVIRN